MSSMKQRIAQAMKDWQPQLSETIANEKIAKKGLKNKRKIAEVQKKAKHSANKMLQSIDKGMRF
jgi:tRNA uridine 5-carbamoylmethylation protein Kti12